ncbi:MAG: phosphoenolpyruvate--protein phosphotransferase [Gemmatimonadota bacterium]|nr:phosphoenolpyruvate--protein phosphotransferase [Gemmatimonadota bacterium]
MSDASAPTILEGFPAAEGIAKGTVRGIVWSIPEVAHTVVEAGSVDRELGRFRAALADARRQLEVLKSETEGRLGPVEARIFDPQILMLDDPDVVNGTERYIAENRLGAARAFDWRMLELKERWSQTDHPMVLDRLNDLADLKLRVLTRLLALPEPWDMGPATGVVAVARDLTPSFVATLDTDRVVALATDEGTRTSHWAILARSLQIPAVAGLNRVSTQARDGQMMVVDGRSGRVVIDPDATEAERFESRRSAILGWRREIAAIAREDAVTLDRTTVALRANLDLPGEAARALEYGADGIGLFRTEFLVVGRNRAPGEEEQYRAYRSVAETFADRPVLIRTFDLGGDKFPVFLRAPAEENPLLGRRGVRVLPDETALFLKQLRAILRATAHGDVRIMVPLVNTPEEITSVRRLLRTAADQLRREGMRFSEQVKLGAMIETPAAALQAWQLAAHADFLSIGTNDLVQYTLAVDRTSTRLAHLFDELHPAVLRQISMVADAGRQAGVEVNACGEMAARPLGALLLLGLGVEALSVAWPSLLEIKRLVRRCRMSAVRAAASAALSAPASCDVRDRLNESLGDVLGTWIGLGT